MGTNGREDDGRYYEYALRELLHADCFSAGAKPLLRLALVGETQKPSRYQLPTLAEARHNAELINQAIQQGESLTLHFPYVTDADLSQGY